MFEFRKKHETPKSRERLSHWERSLYESSHRVELIVEERNTTQPRKGDGIIARRRKAIAMSSNALLHEQTQIANRNPMLAPAGLLSLHTREAAASRVQGYIRKRQLLRGVRSQTRTQNNQTYREFVFAYLSKIISAPRHEEKWRQLLLGAEDAEVAETYSEYDQEHVIKKARSIANALQVLCERTRRNELATGKRLAKPHQRNHAKLDGEPFRFGI
jgi:hypothetical protein